jgi:uncharacterized protein YdhG (YjbR/CyaY superfamily)
VASAQGYLDDLSPEERAEFERVREIVLELVPDAEVKPAYGILSIARDGKWLIYWGAFKNHLSVYPPTHKYTPEDPVSREEITERVNRRLRVLAKG